MLRQSLFLLVLLFQLVNGYKFLFYQTLLGRSHLQFSGALIDTLVDAGHEVLKICQHLLIAEWNPSVKENGTIKATTVRRIRTVQPSPWMQMGHMSNAFTSKVPWLRPEDMRNWYETVVQFCQAALDDEDLLRWLSAEKFDAAFTPPYDYCGHGLFYVSGIRAVAVYSATPLEDMVVRLLGLPNPPSYLQNSFRANPLDGDHFGYKSRFWNFFLRATLPYTGERERMFGQTEVFRSKYGNTFPDLENVFRHSDLVFVNSVEFLDIPRPITHQVIYIGGIANKKPKPLEHTKVQLILNESKAGVVVFSFGSLVQTGNIPKKSKLKFINAFAHFPDYSFIWKYDSYEEDADLFANSSNIYPISWIPQVDLLNDRRVKAFISHTGLNSLTEAAFAGQPILSIPLFGDQQYNSAVVVKRGTGLFLDKLKIKEKTIIAALGKLLKDPSYRNQAQRLAAMMAKKPNEAKQQFIQWSEFLAEFQDLSNLQLAAVDLNLMEYFCLDIIIPCILVTVLILYVLLWIIRRAIVRLRLLLMKQKIA